MRESQSHIFLYCLQLQNIVPSFSTQKEYPLMARKTIIFLTFSIIPESENFEAGTIQFSKRH